MASDVFVIPFCPLPMNHEFLNSELYRAELLPPVPFGDTNTDALDYGTVVAAAVTRTRIGRGRRCINAIWITSVKSR